MRPAFETHQLHCPRAAGIAHPCGPVRRGGPSSPRAGSRSHRSWSSSFVRRGCRAGLHGLPLCTYGRSHALELAEIGPKEVLPIEERRTRFLSTRLLGPRLATRSLFARSCSLRRPPFRWSDLVANAFARKRLPQLNARSRAKSIFCACSDPGRWPIHSLAIRHPLDGEYPKRPGSPPAGSGCGWSAPAMRLARPRSAGPPQSARLRPRCGDHASVVIRTGLVTDVRSKSRRRSRCA